MAHFLVVKGTSWGVKSYPLAEISDHRVEASTLKSAFGKAARSLTDLIPPKVKAVRMMLEVVRI